MSYGGRSESDICQQKLSQIIEGVNVNIHFLLDWKTSTVPVFFSFGRFSGSKFTGRHYHLGSLFGRIRTRTIKVFQTIKE